MARYIDADELLNNLPDDLPYKASVKRVLIQAPTADVVPKSEVKEAVEKLMSATDKVICEAKQEVAREIADEVMLTIILNANLGLSATQILLKTHEKLVELKNKYTKSEDKV